MTPDSIRRALWLLDTADPEPSALRSNIATAVREARQLVGRDPVTGEAPDPNPHAMSWAGALVWFVFIEQIGQCFRLVGTTTPSDSNGKMRSVLESFGGLSSDEASSVVKLRHRFAHDYSLAPPDGPRRFQLDDGPHLVISHGDLTVVSLPMLTEVCEAVLRGLRKSVSSGRVEVAHRGGIDRVVARFTMTYYSE